jgi:hypothetical protein
MTMKCYFKGDNIKGEGNITMSIPTLFGWNLGGLRDEKDIAREAEREVLMRYNEVVHVTRVVKI